MADTDHTELNIIGGRLDKSIKAPKKKSRRVIKADQISELKRIMTIGGDCKEDNSKPPSIILEREGERICRIIVKCTCGRHAELICEEEEKEEGNSNENI